MCTLIAGRGATTGGVIRAAAAALAIAVAAARASLDGTPLGATPASDAVGTPVENTFPRACVPVAAPALSSLAPSPWEPEAKSEIGPATPPPAA
jgi:hypothetical protein